MSGRLSVRIKPSAGVEKIEIDEGGEVRIRVNAPPVAGKANARLIAVLAGALRVPKAAVTIVRGHTGRQKLIEVSCLSAEEIVSRIKQRE